MNSRREHRKKVYNNLYKKYLSLMKKTDTLRTGNRLLQSTNSEISKGIIGLKKEMRKCLLINSNLKSEIHDLTIDKKHLMDDNKGLYNTLTTLRNDTEALEKRISQLLDSLDPEIKSSSNPKVNGLVRKNPKDTSQLPESNYQRYNFKDFIYIQDLSPIMEENAEVKHLIKPSDITRRLGHRAKVPHPDKCPESVEVNGLVFEDGAETNIVVCSPSPVRDSVGISSLSDNVVLPSDSENSLSEKDFDSSLFANVFPRRRMINNGFSLSLGSVEEEGNKELNIENNSSLASEKCHQEESIIENTCSHFQHNIEDIIDTDVNACNGGDTEMYNLSELKEEPSSYGQLNSSSKLLEDATVEDVGISTSSLKRTPDDRSKKSSNLGATCITPTESKSDAEQLSRTADRNSVKSSKCPSSGRKSLEDSKKSLRPKKPLNFTESPVVKMNQKRKRKLVKATK